MIANLQSQAEHRGQTGFAGNASAQGLKRGMLAEMHSGLGCEPNTPRRFDGETTRALGKRSTRTPDPEGARRADELLARLDPADFLYDLGRSVLAVLSEPQTANLFLSSDIAPTLYAHLVQRFGHMPPPPTRAGRGLAAWQERTAKKLLAADLTEAVYLDPIAKACGLSPNRFIKAFRATTGLTPFAWLRAVRVGRARELLCESSLSLAQITYDCGFSDQAHFTRSFTALVGVTPGAWRRAHRA